MIVIFVVVVERESEESVRVLVYVHIESVVLSIAMLFFSIVVLVSEIARGVVKVELERDVASDGGVDDKLVVFLERWVLLQSLVCL